MLKLKTEGSFRYWYSSCNVDDVTFRNKISTNNFGEKVFFFLK